MKLLKMLFVIPLMLLLVSCTSQSEGQKNGISGRIENGLRILPVNRDNAELEYTVFRGDYIVFDFEEKGSYEMNIPSLEISTFMPKPDTEKPYIKMKQSGEFSFVLGQSKGIIKVIELTEPNYTELTAQETSDLLANTDPIIIDVRTNGEYEVSHLRGANLLPVQILSENLDRIEQYKNDDILLYCKSGNRSTVAAKILLDAGFTKIYNMRHGIGDWIRNGHPVE